MGYEKSGWRGPEGLGVPITNPSPQPRRKKGGSMALIHCHPASPRQIAANRRNSLKSTGPRTGAGKRSVALNPFEHGLRATPDTQFREAMIERGEDPGEYERLHQDLRKAWEPANAIQALLVRDLTNLYWKKIRSERAQAAKDLQAARSLEHERKAREVAAPCQERTVEDYEVEVRGTKPLCVYLSITSSKNEAKRSQTKPI